MANAFEERLDNVLAHDSALDVDTDVAAPSVGAHDEIEVRLLRKLRPVPPLPRRSSQEPARSRPMYDPWSARRRQMPEWLVAYTATLVACDIAAALTACVAVAVSGTVSALDVELVAVAALAWPVLLLWLGTYAEYRHGTGASEYLRVAIAGLISIVVADYAGQVRTLAGVNRSLLVGVPVATLLSLLNRALNRRWLHRARRQGTMTKRVVLVGRDAGVLDLATRLRRDPTAGLSVVGACIPSPTEPAFLEGRGLAVLGGLDDVIPVLDGAGADAVVVASASETAGQYLRHLCWRLEGTNIDVLAAPGLVEVAPNRLHVRPTTTVPLVQIKEPEFRGRRRLIKAILDRTAAAVLLVLGAPLFVVITAAIRFTSRGPALYRQRRVGKRGRPFAMLKFRSMVLDAERALNTLLERNEGNSVLFKLRRDPRVTRVGRFLRRYSLDELPQLINVLKGEMSFVGPRPALEGEVARYGPDMHRRLLVKPGITGLWQVSGRSDLSWDEAVELDVRYVENWSLGLDLAILLRTVRAVLRSPGAY